MEINSSQKIKGFKRANLTFGLILNNPGVTSHKYNIPKTTKLTELANFYLYEEQFHIKNKEFMKLNQSTSKEIRQRIRLASNTHYLL